MQMVLPPLERARNIAGTERDDFERGALRITGGAFYLLAAGLAITSVLNLIRGHRPETTFWGIVVAAVSIITMWLLIPVSAASTLWGRWASPGSPSGRGERHSARPEGWCVAAVGRRGSKQRIQRGA